MNTQKPLIIFYACVAAVGGFLFGFDSAVINGTVDALQAAFGSTSVGTGFSVASMLLGCAAGALGSGTAADRFGRKTVMLASALAFLLSALGSGWADTSAEFILYRLIGGLAVGAASVIAPAYIAEISPPDIRGRLGSLQQLAIVLGLFAAMLSNYLIAGASGGAMKPWLNGWPSWSWMFWAEVPPCVLYFLLLLFLPESPRNLLARGRDGEARRVLASISPPEQVEPLLASIRESLHGLDKPHAVDLFRPGTRRLLPVVILGCMMAALQQLSGINVIFYYGSTMWQAAGFAEDKALFINVVSGAINIGSTITAMLLIDRVGRRPMLLVGAVVMTVSLGLVAGLFSSAGTDAAGALTLAPAAARAALVAAHVYLIGFAVTWGPCLWVLLSEMFPNRIRAGAMSLATFVLWMANFIITMTFPVFLKTIGLGGSYWIYTAFALASFILVLRSVKETKGRTLESLSEEPPCTDL